MLSASLPASPPPPFLQTYPQAPTVISRTDGPFGEERPHLETFFFHPVFFQAAFYYSKSCLKTMSHLHLENGTCIKGYIAMVFTPFPPVCKNLSMPSSLCFIYNLYVEYLQAPKFQFSAEVDKWLSFRYSTRKQDS